MITYMSIDGLHPLEIGHVSDNLTHRVEIDCSAWKRKYPALTRFEICVTRPDGMIYCPKTEANSAGKLVWVITDAETAIPGEGSYQVIGTGRYGDRRASRPAGLSIEANMPGIDSERAPDPSKPWVKKVFDAAAAAEQSAKDAAVSAETMLHPPIIGENGNWWLWDVNIGDYADSGFGSRAEVRPYTLPTASSGTKGGVKIGSGLQMDGEVLNAEVTQEDIDALSGEITQMLDRAYAYRIANGSRLPYTKFTKFDNKISGQNLNVVSTIDYTADGISSLTLKHYGKNLLVPPYKQGGIGEVWTQNGIRFTVLDDGRIHCKGTCISSSNSWFVFGDFGFPLSWMALTTMTNYPDNISDNATSVNDGIANRAPKGTQPDVSITANNNSTGTTLITVIANRTVDVVVSPQVELNWRPTKYEMGKRKDYVVDFGRVVHGGSYDWQTGILTVTHDANGELANPYTLQFEPQVIAAYDGINNVYTSAGYSDITAFEPVPEKTARNVFDTSNIRVLYLDGDTTGISKDNEVTLDWWYPVHNYAGGTCTLKWQGSSSLSYDKKNYTVKFDQAFEAQAGWGKQKKYCLKANWIDFTHCRNVVSAKLWGEIVNSRNSVNATLAASPNNGAVDGFPVAIILNDEFLGLYTWNIPKDAWMANMGSGTQECILCANMHSDANRFKATATLGTDFDVEYITDETNTDWAATSLNNLISACVNSDGSDLDSNIGTMLDWESAIDWMIFTALIDANDMVTKNYLLSTFDGTKWIFGAYDIDTSYGLYWTGTTFTTPATNGYAGGSLAGNAAAHRVAELILTYKKAELKERYNQLRGGVMSDANVALMFWNFAGIIPLEVKNEELVKWGRIPSNGANSVHQIVDWYRMRSALIDKEVAAL